MITDHFRILWPQFIRCGLNLFFSLSFYAYSRALRIFVDVLGPDHEEVGSALNLIAVVVGEQGRHFEVCTVHPFWS